MTPSNNTRTLYTQIANDPDFRSKLAESSSPEALIAEVQSYAKARDLFVSVEDIRQALTPPEGELSDQELEQVVGGKAIAGGLHNLLGITNYLEIGTIFADDMKGGLGDDTMYGLSGDDSMEGGYSGNDKMNGGSGNDTIEGRQGNDVLDGGSGNDDVYGGDGNDKLDGGDGNDYLDGGYGNDTLHGGAGDDTIDSGYGWSNNELDGGAGNDLMYAGFGNDNMNGGSGNDLMFGDDGHDTMQGGDGHDNMSGGEGNDILDGGAGNDILTGGTGSDVFVFGANDGSDTITDFNPAEDKLQLQGVTSPHQLNVSSDGGNTVISYGETTITLQGVEMTADEVWVSAGNEPLSSGNSTEFDPAWLNEDH